ncbi:MAG: hypothetical protein AMXMBFR45_05070 [Gammaproteobacteria bacterium]|nr:peptidase M48 [Gammaproteobacteria bacterium]MCE7896752.1 peptidase M48 [Gammaproteobacteria bacterium PRO8]MDL1880596.1 peptidase M48 [Gammaproteobacteria bacterium PRO2]GIK35402.1 MAG: Zn-dependent protease [Gammaproteobacteria bacterium]
MDFWARQADARRRSHWLLLLFAAAVLAVLVAVNFVVLVVLGLFDAGEAAAGGTWLTRHPVAVTITTLIVLAITGITSLYKSIKLGAGGGVVARELGGMRVQADTTDPDERRLLNIVEEMAIAAGLPVPAVYVLGEEQGINAFAAGHTAADAAIAVTRGALQHLNRTELQGVIGHEFSHILNGDMRLNIRLIGLLSGLLVIAIGGRMLYQLGSGSGSRRRGDGSLALAGLALMGIGHIGVFFGRLIQAAVSRQREFLADAAAVQFTRDPAGLRDALIKIGSVESSRLSSPRSAEVAHMLFAPGLTRWMATHPPLAERIRALDASFDPATVADLRLEVRPQPLGIVRVLEEDGMAKSLPAAQLLDQQAIALNPGSLPARVGNPRAADITRAGELQALLPGVALAGDAAAAQATALLLALVLDSSAEVRAVQLEKIRIVFGSALDAQLQAQMQVLNAVPVEGRLALLGRIVPALRRLPPATRGKILDTLGALARTDGVISVFEYTLGTLAGIYIDETLAPRRVSHAIRLAAATVELQILLSTLATQGHGTAQDAEQAYARGIACLGLKRPPPFRPRPGWAAALDRALRCLDGLAPMDKARVVEALGATIVHDGRVSLAEAELLRAICAALHCPLPPLREKGV